MTKRDGIVVAVLGAVMVLGAYWWFALKPLRAELTTLDAQVTTERQALDAARQEVGAARAARGRYVADYAAIARLGKAVPADDDVPALVLQLETAAQGADVEFEAVRLASAGTAAPAPAPSQTAAVAAASGTTPPATGAAPAAGSAPAAGTSGAAPTTPAAPTQAAAAGLPPGATVGSAGFATMPFNFVFEGSFLKMQSFLERVQRFVDTRDGRLQVSGRLLTIDGVGIAAGGKGFPTVKATITATAYVLPAEQGLTAGATPQSPAAAPPAATPAAPGTATASTSPSTPVAAAGATP